MQILGATSWSQGMVTVSLSNHHVHEEHSYASVIQSSSAMNYLVYPHIMGIILVPFRCYKLDGAVCVGA